MRGRLQGGGVDEFDHRSQIVALGAGVAQGAAAQQQQNRAQALATGRNDVLGNLADQGHARIQALGDDTVHLGHVGGDQGEDGCGAVFGGRQVGNPARARAQAHGSGKWMETGADYRDSP